MYLKEIGRKRMLTKREEIELGKAIQEGTREERELAKERLVQANLRLVVSIAKKNTLGKEFCLWIWCKKVR